MHVTPACFLLLQGPPVLLIHGYGASAYHWRYQIPALAQNYRVFALDLLGFGWSEKALVEYSSGGLWGQQIGDFIREVVYAGDAAASSSSSSEPVVLVGNSLGGYACLNAAAKSPDLIR
jgi:pimeloyl-ACP methyl ester carboxylesterase